MESRRNFLAGLGAAALAPHALPAIAPASRFSSPNNDGEYVVGVTSNPQLPSPAGDLVLKTWLSVEADGTGFGILTDRYGPGAGSHLSVQSRVRDCHGYTWQGFVARSNDPQLVNQPFTLSSNEHNGQAVLELVLLGQTFRGQGTITR
ncbi:MAG: hypothetical protein U1E73_00990 [Planctomycetota bacterium]